MGRYAEVYADAKKDPEAFWAKAAEDVFWYEKWERVLDDRKVPFYEWFAGGVTNTCYNALDLHVDSGRADQLALIHDSPVTNSITKYTYRELRDRVAAFAGVLRAQGIEYGDRVVIYMPMIPEAAMAMLACARIGAIHSVVFGGFAPRELATRIDDATPKAIVTASAGIEGQKVIPYKPLLDEAIDIAQHKVGRVVVLQRPQVEASIVDGRDVDWHAAHAGVEPADCVPVKATDPCYILYTSGTTGIPKGVVRATGGHIVALKWSMKNIYGVEPGEVYWAASDVGWVVGHSYIVYGPLFHGCTTVMYEGKPIGTPDAGAFWRVISEHGVSCMFTAPTAIRAIRKQDPDAKLLEQYDMSKFRSQFLAGERCDPDTLKWCQEKLRVPVVDHWWQTETGWAIASNCLGIEELPVKPGSPTCAVPGWDVQILDPVGQPMKANEVGAIMLKLPLPPGTLPTLWQNDERFVDSYLTEHEGYYKTGDAGYLDDDGYVYVMSRTDDIINVAGHRLSTGAWKRCWPPIPTSRNARSSASPTISRDKFRSASSSSRTARRRARAKSSRTSFRWSGKKSARWRRSSRRQRSSGCPRRGPGKSCGGTMQKIADSQEFRMPATIDDPEILSEIEAVLESIGYASKK